MFGPQTRPAHGISFFWFAEAAECRRFKIRYLPEGTSCRQDTETCVPMVFIAGFTSAKQDLQQP